MNISSVIMIGVIMIITLSKNSMKRKWIFLFCLNIFMEITYMQGYFIRFGKFEFNHSAFPHMIMLFYSLYFSMKNEILLKKKMGILFIGFISSIFAGLIISIVYPYENLVMSAGQGDWDNYVMGKAQKDYMRLDFLEIFMTLLLLMNFFNSLIIVKEKLKKSDFLYSLYLVNSCTNIILLYGLLEWITKRMFESDIIIKLNEWFFGVGHSTYTDLIMRGDSYQLQGITREPSHFSFSLFIIGVLYIIEGRLAENLIENKIKWEKKFMNSWLRLFVIAFLMLSSGSFSSIVYLLIFIIVLSWGGKKRKNSFGKLAKIILASLMSFSFLYFLLEYFSDTFIGRRLEMSLISLDYFLQGKWFLLDVGKIGSTLPRLVSIIDTFSDFLHRPLLGLGISAQIAFGGISTVLSDIGILGLFLWIRMIFFQYDKDQEYDYWFIFFILVLSNILMGNRSVLYSIYVILLIESTKYYGKELNDV